MEAEEQEVTVSESESEAALLEEVKVEDCQRLFRTCICINFHFMRLRVLTIEVMVAASEA